MIKLDFSKFGEIKILVAEDNDISQKMFEKIFEINNLNSKIVNNGLEVLTALEKEKYDILIMDMQMPYLDGYATTRKIRERNSGQSKIPIVAITARSGGNEKEMAFDCGADKFVYKPFRIDTMLTTIYDVFDTGNSHYVPEDIFNFKTIDEIYGDDETFKIEMISEFINKFPERLLDLYNHLENKELDEAQKIAHKNKSSVSVLGIDKAFEYFNEIENVNDIGKAKAIYSDLKNYMDEVFDALKKYALKNSK